MSRRRSVQIFDADAGDDAVLARLKLLIPLRDRAHPLNGEILECDEQRAEVVPGNFHIV